VEDSVKASFEQDCLRPWYMLYFVFFNSIFPRTQVIETILICAFIGEPGEIWKTISISSIP